MLIYNHQKEFLGIDEADLQTLGYHDLSALRSEATDIADLFVKTPGYIHNFKHVHWIDFVACSDPAEIQKVIIHANGKNFRATISVSNAYLIENPSSKAYLVHLNNLHQLNDNEADLFQEDLVKKQILPVTEQPRKSEPEPKFEPETEFDPLPPEIKPEPVTEKNILMEDTALSKMPEDDLKLDIDLEPTQTNVAIPAEVMQHEDTLSDTYIYDPAVASKELGLPLDLIEEFIQDFIAQANDFKPDLYAALADGNIDTVKSLAHKLKGVAANLRVEDAFEILSIINTTSDTQIIKSNLELLYKIMAKLAGKETIEENIQEEDEDLQLDFKDDFDLVTDIKAEDLSIKEVDNKTQIDLLKEEPPTEKQSEIPIEVLYSKTKVANEIGLDQESFNELFQDYIQESFSILNDMRKSVDNDNLSEIKTEVLKLKGMSDNMRINDFNEELEQLLYSTDHEERVKVIQRIELIINKLSEQGE